MYAYTFFCFDPTLATKTTVHNNGRNETKRVWRKWTTRSKWAVQMPIYRRPKGSWNKRSDLVTWTLKIDVKWTVPEEQVDGLKSLKMYGHFGIRVVGPTPTLVLFLAQYNKLNVKNISGITLCCITHYVRWWIND